MIRGMDKNGNAVIKLERLDIAEGSKGFSIQTNGNLQIAHRLSHGKIERGTIEYTLVINEVREYCRMYGTKAKLIALGFPYEMPPKIPIERLSQRLKGLWIYHSVNAFIHDEITIETEGYPITKIVPMCDSSHDLECDLIRIHLKDGTEMNAYTVNDALDMIEYIHSRVHIYG